ncbi:MAG: hypothetical protein ACO3RT_01570 [Arenicellales bacterium]
MGVWAAWCRVWPYRHRPSVLIGLLLLSVLTHIAAAYFSEGRIHPDSDYQILEFAQFKLGPSSDLTLPWEFFEAIRPALQPAIALMVHEGLAHGDPFKTSLLLRFISAGLGLLSAWLLCGYAFRWVRKERFRLALVVLISTFWMLPWFHVRFSSESWAASLLAIAIVCVSIACERSAERRWLLATLGGLTLGMVFFLRFPSAFAILGLGLWVLFIGRPGVKILLAIAVGFSISLLANVMLDRWFYGEWVFTPWNYLVANIVEGRAAEFGVDPWWYYIEKLLLVLVPPVSLLLLVALVAAVILKPRHVLTWVSVCFLIGHSLIGHKETRFLIPIITPLLILGILGMEALSDRFKAYSKRRFIIRGRVVMAGLFLTMNSFALVYVSVAPAQQEAVIHKWIYQMATQRPVTIFTWNQHPYHDGRGMVSFFRSPDVHFEPINADTDLGMILQTHDLPLYIFTPSVEVPELLRRQCPALALASSALPTWLRRWDTAGRLASVRIWSIYRCGKDASS